MAGVEIRGPSWTSLTGECCDCTILENITSMAGVEIRGAPRDICTILENITSMAEVEIRGPPTDTTGR